MNLDTILEEVDSESLQQIETELALRLQSQMASHAELTQRSNILIGANLAALAFITASQISKSYFGILTIVFLAIGFGFSVSSIIQQRVSRPGLDGTWFEQIQSEERSKIRNYRIAATNDSIKSNDVTIARREMICNTSSIFLLIAAIIHLFSLLHQAAQKF